MPLTGETKRLWDRNYRRERRHGNWRAVIAIYQGLCAYCGQPLVHDLHEPFGEIRENNGDGNGKMQQRAPACLFCHSEQHPKRLAALFPTRRHSALYLEDISREVRDCGSWDDWCRKYGIDPNVIKLPQAVDEPA